MKEIHLPVVRDSTSLSAALATLRSQRRGALLVERDGAYVLFSAARIAAGRSRKLGALRELEPDSAPQSAPKPTGRTPVHSARAPMSGVDLDTEDSITGGPTRELPDIGHVLIPERTLADVYVAAPKDYYCDGPRHHPFPPPDVTEGDPCPRKDGYKIVSAK